MICETWRCYTQTLSPLCTTSYYNMENPINYFTAIRAQSLDPRARRDHPTDFDFDELPCKTPVLCNKYAIDELDNVHGGNKRPTNLRSQSMPRQHQHHNHNFGVIENRFEPTPPKILPSHQQHHLYLPEDEYEMQPVRKNKRRERGKLKRIIGVCSVGL